MNTLIYLIGEPGVGKTTALAAVTAGWRQLGVLDDPPARVLFGDRAGWIRAVELGRRRGMFSGTDALPMNAVVPAEQYLTSGRAAAETELLLAEGARLANTRFLRAAVSAGWVVHLIHLRNPEVAATRRAARGTRQDPSWVRGAATRARNLAAQPPAGVTVHTLEPAGDPAATANRIRALAGARHEATA